MSDQPEKTCKAQFEGEILPPRPWSQDMPLKSFQPLVELIDQRTQSDMFRRVGKYSQNSDYYDFARKLDDEDKDSGTITDKNGVTTQVNQYFGYPVDLVIEDKEADLKETVHLDERTHVITSDTVESCGVSRSREFTNAGMSRLKYTFPGATIDIKPNAKGVVAPVLIIDGTDNQQ